MTVNPTMRKFGYPETLVQEYEHWVAVARPAQPTLGSLALICKDEAEAFSSISAGAFGELALVTADIETSLRAFRPFDRINYLMLMMVDPDVHFHVLPRYASPQEFHGETYRDAGWPAVPDLAAAVTPQPDMMARLVADLRQNWVRS